MKTQQALLLLAFTAVAGCAGSNSAVVVDPMPPGGAWLDLSLTVTGPAANDDKRKACMREARDAGVRLREGAAVAAALYLDKEGNRISFNDGRPEQMLGNWATPATCRLAVAAAINLDERVKMIEGNSAPMCKMVGTVTGIDKGVMVMFSFTPASRDAAIASMKLAALRLRANYVAMDAFSNVLAGVPMTATSVSGRAFVCATAPSPTDKPQSEGPQI